MKDVFIVAAVRTPVGKRNGYLREWKAPVLNALVLDEAVARAGIESTFVEDVITGCVYQVGEQGFDIARMGVFATETYPNAVPGVSVNRQCGSSLTSIQLAHGMVASGNMDVVLASGCEIMSKYPIGSDMDGKLPDGRPQGNPIGDFYMKRANNKLYTQGMAAEAIAKKWDISREQCEQFAVESHQKAAKATDEGYFEKEILPTKGLDKEGKEFVNTKDETIRPDTNLEKLATLKTVLGSNMITAGISSPITDGSSAVLLASEDAVKKHDLKPIARIVANAVVGSDPELMLTGPIDVTPMVLKKAGLTKDDIDIFEVNEAFAPIPLAWEKEMGTPREKLNVNGGAMALGHPVGNSGCRLTVTAIYELMRREARYALITLCTGGAMAPATIIERV